MALVAWFGFVHDNFANLPVASWHCPIISQTYYLRILGILAV